LKTHKRLSVAAIIACLALFGALMVSSTADAKKKKKATSVTASRTFPTSIPVASPTVNSFTAIPLNIGKKAKGKIVDSGAPEITFSATGVVGSLDNLDFRLTAPNGRTVFLENPAGNQDAAFGPTTISANSPIDACPAGAAPPPPPCFDPERSLLAPYAGVIGDPGLALFSGIGAKGTWTLKVQNGDETNGATVTSASLKVPLASKFKD
jgi:hypothetical protein